MGIPLADLWLLIIAFLLVLAVVLDGFGLGVGLLALAAGPRRRALMMDSLEHVWVPNQTWLVVLGGMLFGAFPRFYGVVLTALYLPLLLMLFGLIARAVAFEFRAQAAEKAPWGRVFAAASTAAAAGEGLALGGLLGGLPVQGGRFVGGAWDWFSPLALLVAVGVGCGYVLLGAAFLVYKTAGDVQERAYRQARIASWLVLAAAAAVNALLAARYPHVAGKWSWGPQLAGVAVFPLLALVAFAALQWTLRERRSEVAPFAAGAVLVLAVFAGGSAALYPYMIPPFDTVDMAAASPKTLRFMLVATVLLLPVMLAYNLYQVQVFRGKVGASGGGYGS
ncbi:MAG TPA: cytochrome d ubiquinol oxidase subunit II [bacterium]